MTRPGGMARLVFGLCGAGSLAGCAVLDGVEAKKPNAGDIARIIEVEHACSAEASATAEASSSEVSAPQTPTTPAVPAAAGKPACPADKQPRRVVVRDLSCARLPLRAGVPEVARARCAYVATIEYTAGNRVELGRAESDFGLHDYAPGAWAPIFQWARTK